MTNPPETTDKSTRIPTRTPESAKIPAAGVSAAVPETMLLAMQSHLAQREALAAADITVHSAQPVTWRNGSMGCPVKGMAYSQALVPGYRVILRSGDTDYAYHASRNGGFILCDAPAAEGIAPPDAGGQAVE